MDNLMRADLNYAYRKHMLKKAKTQRQKNADEPYNRKNAEKPSVQARRQ